MFSDPVVFTLSAALLGLCVGSFLNVVIHRLPKMMERQGRAECAELGSQPAPAAERYTLVVPRSACPSCNRPIVVKKGQVLCIVEAMKLMNEIEAEVEGKITEVYVLNATPVEFGEKLFRIEPA